MSRTHKRPYRGARAVDRSCRSHGGCPWCLGNHQHQQHKAELDAIEQIVEALAGATEVARPYGPANDHR